MKEKYTFLMIGVMIGIITTVLFFLTLINQDQLSEKQVSTMQAVCHFRCNSLGEVFDYYYLEKNECICLDNNKNVIKKFILDIPE